MTLELSPTLSENAIKRLHEGQKKMTKMLFEFDRICRKYSLSYWCVGGTLIGAIRHSGWIPWDGDVDVHMLDKDWQRFCEVSKDELPTTMYAFDTSDECSIGKVRDLYSCYTSQPQTLHTGLQIDVFKYKETTLSGKHAIQAYINIWRGDYFYRDTGNFEYDLIFPLKELNFEGIAVFVPNDYKTFSKICYDAFPPPLPPIEKRYPAEGPIDPFNPHPLVLEKYKDIYSEKVQEWFRRSALSFTSEKPLHHASGWSYLSVIQWQEFINHCLKDEELNSNEKVFEGGCGVGAVLQALNSKNPFLDLYGIDICKEAVEKCATNVMGSKVQHGSVCNLSYYETNTFDFVLSVCVLSYLDSLDLIRNAVLELLRIAKPYSRVHLCVFTEKSESLKSLRQLVPKTWWDQFSEIANVEIVDIPMVEFNGRYNVFLKKK
jgi:phosphorylcholine metabolism protein LicD